MKGNGRGNLLLTELVIVILFFALSATVIVRLFMAAYAVSSRSEYTSTAVMETGNWAERLYAADDMEKLLLDEGFVFEDNSYCFETESGLELSIELASTDNAGGETRSASISASKNGEVYSQIECRRYVPEVTE